MSKFRGTQLTVGSDDNLWDLYMERRMDQMMKELEKNVVSVDYLSRLSY